MRSRPHVVFATGATALEIAAAGLAVGLNHGLWLLAAGALHAAAAALTWLAARKRRPDLSTVEGDLVLLTALMVPIFGAPLAWCMPAPSEAEEAENAHSVFERYAEHVRPGNPDYERSLFTGDYERDLARELDAESYYEVLRHGKTDQKRNALRRLAELGEPKHFSLIRKCLLDPEHEVRLYAYSELERSGRVYEEEIAKRARELDKHPDNSEDLLALARAHFHYAQSGIHDDGMAAFYFRTAERFAIRARALAPDDPEPVWIRARSLSRIGEFEQAEEVLGSLPPEQLLLPESCIARAAIAFRRRDYAAARVETERLKETEAEIPGWLLALEARG
jgi:Flp pilus assembly protein TadD